MTTHMAARDELANAFDAFRNVSAQLSASYRTLETRFGLLAGELERSHATRSAGALEHERLAQRYRLLLEALPAGVVVLDGHGRVVECNPAARELLGDVTAAALWRDVVTRVFAPRVDDGPDVSLANGRRVSISTCGAGAEPGQILVISDVTDSRALSEAMARMERMAAVGNLAATLAHQIRTPLASALLFAAGLRSARADEGERARAGARLVERLRHLGRLVDDMLLFARQGRFELEEQPVAALIEHFAGTRKGDIAAGRLMLAVDVEVTQVRVSANARAFASALDNLVCNALDAGGGEARVRVHAAAAPGGGIRVSVSDDGPGMAPEVAARAFEPFFTTRGGEGTGLGLAIVRAIVDAHAGDIGVDSAPGRGCTFHVDLPRR